MPLARTGLARLFLTISARHTRVQGRASGGGPAGCLARCVQTPAPPTWHISCLVRACAGPLPVCASTDPTSSAPLSSPSPLPPTPLILSRPLPFPARPQPLARPPRTHPQHLPPAPCALSSPLPFCDSLTCAYFTPRSVCRDRAPSSPAGAIALKGCQSPVLPRRLAAYLPVLRIPFCLPSVLSGPCAHAWQRGGRSACRSRAFLLLCWVCSASARSARVQARLSPPSQPPPSRHLHIPSRPCCGLEVQDAGEYRFSRILRVLIFSDRHPSSLPLPPHPTLTLCFLPSRILKPLPSTLCSQSCVYLTAGIR